MSRWRSILLPVALLTLAAVSPTSDDARLKELQSLVDCSRSPSTTGSAAIEPVFDTTSIVDEGGRRGFGSYWTSTPHVAEGGTGASAVYVSFGEALGWMRYPRTGRPQLMDVHGAGARRSDPKVGDPSSFPYGRGPQGDVIRILHLVRPVRGGEVEAGAGEGRAPTVRFVADQRRDDPPDRDDDRQGPPDRGDDEQQRPRPPREAIDACSSADEGDRCSFEGRRGEDVTGTCRELGDDLACVPAGGPPKQPRRGR